MQFYIKHGSLLLHPAFLLRCVSTSLPCASSRELASSTVSLSHSTLPHSQALHLCTAQNVLGSLPSICCVLAFFKRCSTETLQVLSFINILYVYERHFISSLPTLWNLPALVTGSLWWWLWLWLCHPLTTGCRSAETLTRIWPLLKIWIWMGSRRHFACQNLQAQSLNPRTRIAITFCRTNRHPECAFLIFWWLY